MQLGDSSLGSLVEESSPMKRGLKEYSCHRPCEADYVEESSPMKRGLKEEGRNYSSVPADC